MSRLFPRLFHLVIASAVVAVLASPAAPSARAEPAVSPAIGWAQLGLSDSLEVTGNNEPTQVEMPVPQGVSPTVLTGTIGASTRVAGRVDVLDGRGVVLASTPIPLDVPSAPFVVDVAAAEVVAGVATLTFVIRDVDDIGTERCRQPPSVTLSQLATTYSGPTPNPRTVADFLPGYLDRVTISIGETPTREQQQAALVLVAELTRLYRPMPIRVDVSTGAAAPLGDGAGTQRTIAIVEGDRAGLTVDDPDTPAAVLTISGRGEELLRQVDLFTDRRFDLAQSSSATVTSLDRGAPRTTDSLSFADLGVKAETSVLGVTNLFVGFDASAFGSGPIDGATVHVLARYTPVTNADASLLIRSGSSVLASALLDQSGVVDLTADVPASAISSNVPLALEVRYAPRRSCSDVLDRMTFSVDPESRVTVRPADTDRGGFALLPMAFTPEFDVAVDDVEQIGYVAQAINLMAQQSTVALRPNVTTLDSATSSGSGLLVAAPGGDLARRGMPPPLLRTSEDAVDVEGTPVTGIDLNGPLGVVGAYPNNGRMVLAIDTSGGTGLLDQTFDYVRGLEGRWATLTGDVVATGVAGSTVELSVRMDQQTAAPASASTEGRPWWTWVAVALAAAAVLAVAAAIVLVLRRRARG
ncbi:cellulose biosynthesis cyclic di-GMP-binding regulatory protein BcsB [Mycolicibacterium sediminis]|uniref:Cellulose synthase n=1 Tax=Mycolicibacterium sediminis TaxID=1286180 RepID=A0A7I7QNB4_9MYCO|nr:cellulose biosynthesis cyclic di-GMP-binding regulatory protein BcsB [Mycolicibacterium sediminis]BBY27782.1 hypothetical protein MSEDJ_18780 [Mycolicibacterium sediminis]